MELTKFMYRINILLLNIYEIIDVTQMVNNIETN